MANTTMDAAVARVLILLCGLFSFVILFDMPLELLGQIWGIITSNIGSIICILIVTPILLVLIASLILEMMDYDYEREKDKDLNITIAIQCGLTILCILILKAVV